MIQSYYLYNQDRIGWYRISWWAFLACLATSFFVMIEPAPTDLLFVLALGMFALAPLQPQRMFGAIAITGLVLFVWFTFLSLLFVEVSYVVAVRAVGIEMYLLLLFAMTAYFVRHDGDRAFRMILIALAVGGVIASVIGVLAWLGLMPNRVIFFRDEHMSRVKSTFKDPNVLGPYLIPSIVLMIWMALSAARSRLLVMGAAGLMLACLIVTFSRGAWAHFILSSFFFFFFLLANRKTVLSTLLFAIVMTGVGISGVLFFADDLFASSQNTYLASRLSFQSYDSDRFDHITATLDKIADWPFGIGANQSLLLHGYEAHNTFIVLAYHNGLLAAVGFTLFYFAAVLRCIAMVLRRQDGWLKYAFVLSVLIGLFLLMNVVSGLHWRHVYVVLGLAYGSYHSNEIFNVSCWRSPV